MAVESAMSESYYAATNGTSSGLGTVVSPWDLATALSSNVAGSSNSMVDGGDTIWVRGGAYVGSFTNSLNGAEGSPIHIRAYPGEQPILDGNGFALGSTNQVYLTTGKFVWTYDLEICNSSTNRVDQRPHGVQFKGSENKLINLIVHDNGVGIFMFSGATNSEVYGCLVYNNGYQGEAPDRGHGHGIYAQSNEPKHALRDNIIFNQFGYGVHCFAEGGQLWGFEIEGNISFLNGSISRDAYLEANFLVGGSDNPVMDVLFMNNYGWYPWGPNGYNVQFGYGTIHNDDFVCASNYIGGGFFQVQYWTNISVISNTIALGLGHVVFLGTNGGTYNHLWDSNVYYIKTVAAFESGTNAMSFNQWKAYTGFDSNSSFTASVEPDSGQVFVRTNKYKSGRANIAVFNWRTNNTASVDLSEFMPNGSRYTIRNASDYFQNPVVSGTYSGGSVTIPMTNLTVACPVGLPQGSNAAPMFAAFVLDSSPPNRVLNSRTSVIGVVK